MSGPTKILVAVDGSDNAERAVNAAADLAVVTGARLHLTTVLPRFDLPEALKHLAESEHIEGSPQRQWELVGQRLLDAARDRAIEGRKIETETEVVGGEAGEAIMDAARRNGADLVVVGSRGLGRLEGALMGSVSQKVAALAPVNVLVVR